MKPVREQFEETGRAVQRQLDEIRPGVREGYEALKRVLRLSTEGTRDVIAGNSAAVREKKTEIARIIQETRKRVEIGWLREQLAERASSMLVRLAFVEACVPFLKDGSPEPDLSSFSRKELGVSPQAWLWGVVIGPDEIAEALLFIRTDEKLTVGAHISILRRFLFIAESVENFIADFDRYPDDVVSISGDKRRTIQKRLQRLRERTIPEHRQDLICLIEDIAPD